MPEVRNYVDVVWLGSDDWGTQKTLIASPKIFRKLFLPYRRRINDEFHRLAAEVKTFLHSCGANPRRSARHDCGVRLRCAEPRAMDGGWALVSGVEGQSVWAADLVGRRGQRARARCSWGRLRTWPTRRVR